MVEKLGIVYTPVQIVDFIIHSVNDVLKKEFGRTFTDENVHIIDPFTGTGTFITRLLQSGLINKVDLQRKYENELHANEIVLLAYYIAAVNIENAYHDQLKKNDSYRTFEGICLTDTFQLGEADESDKLFSEMFPANSTRVEAQRKAPIRIIIGNPPYSVGQSSANDNAQNQEYTVLNNRIENTYVAESSASLNRALYDAYIRAFRWSSDRLDKENGGIICFVSNGSWLDGSATSGFRKCLENEFSSIYVFNLRGNARTQGELRRKEKGNVFGSGSRTPISITLLVNNPKEKAPKATIYYQDIGDYLTEIEKLDLISQHHSVLSDDAEWTILKPNRHGDWINQRSEAFEEFIPITPAKKGQDSCESFFTFNSCGVVTSRDAWVYGSNKKLLQSNVKSMIAFYTKQRQAFAKESKSNADVDLNSFLISDPSKIAWSRALKKDVSRGKAHAFDSKAFRVGSYRPFYKQHHYFSGSINEVLSQIPKLFPDSDTKNLAICTSGIGASKGFSVLMTDHIPNFHHLDTSQCFPLYYYEENSQNLPLLSGSSESDHIQKDGISDYILEKAHALYGTKVTKKEIFYYVYGLLHSSIFRSEFANNLKKVSACIPLVYSAEEFKLFSIAGSKLAGLHVNYEEVKPYKGLVIKGANKGMLDVVKMKFLKKDEKHTILFNDYITIENIPDKAYEYIVNGKSAIEWVVERYQIKKDKNSGIVNDPNDWADEVGNPSYILDLLLGIINMSVQTVDIVDNLPKLKFDKNP